MKKRILFAGLLAAAALLFTGCALRTVEEMYSLPKRSEEHSKLQSAIDVAMAGMDYCAPVSGENQQTVQQCDLDGDGVQEYLVFARGSSEKPLQILIFGQDAQGRAIIRDVISSTGSSFEQVEYVQIDDKPGSEIVVGRQVSEQLQRSVSVYSFAGGKAELLMSTGYTRFLTCDLDEDSRMELLVIQPGDVFTEPSSAVLYSCRDGVMERSVEAGLSDRAAWIRRIRTGRLTGGVPAVYVASSANERTLVTDVLALRNGQFTNISMSDESKTSVRTMRNFYVYAEDVDRDGILELPSLIDMRPVSVTASMDQQYLIRWFSLDINGGQTDKKFTYHNYVGGWYLLLDRMWAYRVSVEQLGNTYTFYIWNEAYHDATPIFTIYALTGSDRDIQAVEGSRFPLYSTEGVVFAGRLDERAGDYGITEELLADSFCLIHEDWKTGES